MEGYIFMKKKLTLMFLPFILILSTVSPVFAEETKPSLQLAENAASAVLMDRDTGTVIFEKDAHKPLPPASITKIMTMLLIMEAIDRGEINLKDMVSTGEYAASMGGSQIFLKPGEEMTVEEMLKGIAIASGNDASVAMAEHLDGTEKAFVDKMNKRAKELGMKETTFKNSNGLPADGHVSSAYDIAIMSRELLKHEEITKYTGIYQDYLRKGSENPFWLVNTNKLVRFYEGADGLKTGYTSDALYCLSATAKKGNMRMVAVVMGEPDSKTRNAEVTSMLNYAFTQYTSFPLYKENQMISMVKVEKGKSDKITAVIPYNFSLLLKKGEKGSQYQKVVQIDPDVAAPIKKGQKIGQVVVKKGGKLVTTVDLVALESVEKAKWWDLLKRTSRKMFGGE